MHVLVTGASRGIGRAIAASCVARGDSVLGVRRSRCDQQEHAMIRFTQADLAVAQGRARVLEAVAEAGLPVEGVVLNAGIAHTAPFAQLPQLHTIDPVRAQLCVNLEAPLLLLRELLARELLASQASVLFVGSNLARRGLAGKVAYAASKGGIESAVRALAAELGPSGIRVNAIAPGLTKTDMTGAISESELEQIAQATPLRRIAGPTDIADAAMFFLSHAARYVTGATLDVDGGWGC